ALELPLERRAVAEAERGRAEERLARRGATGAVAQLDPELGVRLDAEIRARVDRLGLLEVVAAVVRDADRHLVDEGQRLSDERQRQEAVVVRPVDVRRTRLDVEERLLERFVDVRTPQDGAQAELDDVALDRLLDAVDLHRRVAVL